ncbi:MAG TPA: STM3941 family protein [Methylotenera sp.]|nr:STM3941 family protein [Methylotenera sp.]HPH06431.1 STM3941 family protein [Methylotenera sp.]HPN00422.1 STM3941 family protein [Methylotenera sp.]
MTDTNQTTIPLSKTKIWMLIFGSIAFVAIGLWMLTLDTAALAGQTAKYRNPAIVHGIAYLCIAFFGLCLLVGIKKLFDTKPGLVISAQGILDHVSHFSPNPVPWRDIKGFDVAEIHKQKMLVIYLENPQPYIESATAMRKLGFIANTKLVGSPWVITASTLKTSFDALLALCQQSLNQYKK